MDEARRVLGDVPRLTFAANRRSRRCEGADALVVVTEWKEFRSPDFDALRRHLKQPVIFDGRNLYEPDVVRGAGFEYMSIGDDERSGRGNGRRGPKGGAARVASDASIRRRAIRVTMHAQFSQWRERVAAARVLVVGDVMLDRYWFGDVERISPEAPVPVVKIARTRGAPRRRRQRRAQRRGAGRAGNAAVGHRRTTSRRTPCCGCSTRTGSRRRSCAMRR